MGLYFFSNYNRLFEDMKSIIQHKISQAKLYIAWGKLKKHAMKRDEGDSLWPY